MARNLKKIINDNKSNKQPNRPNATTHFFPKSRENQRRRCLLQFALGGKEKTINKPVLTQEVWGCRVVWAAQPWVGWSIYPMAFGTP